MMLNRKIEIKADCQDITDGGTMKCPRCGAEMDLGYLIIHSSVNRALVSTIMVYWNIDRSDHGMGGGEVIFGTSGFFKNANIEAYRCSKCQIVSFEYTEKDKADVGGKEFQDEFKAEDYGDVEKYLR